jgi:hypothetical protein
VAGFQRSDNLIRTLAFRCLLWACVIPPPVTVHGCTLRMIPLPPHHTGLCFCIPVDAFLHRGVLDPYTRRFVGLIQPFSPWASYGHPAYRAHPRLLGLSFPFRDLRCLSADFTGLRTPPFLQRGARRSINVVFQGVTPSFDRSGYQFSCSP